MCINSDRYLAMRACATDRTKNDRLIAMIDADPIFNVNLPSDDLFDKMGDLAIRVNIEEALKVVDAAADAAAKNGN